MIANEARTAELSFPATRLFVIWGFVSAMIVLAAGQWAARMESQNERQLQHRIEEGLEKDSQG
jgi:hypothetical protein